MIDMPSDRPFSPPFKKKTKSQQKKAARKKMNKQIRRHEASQQQAAHEALAELPWHAFLAGTRVALVGNYALEEFAAARLEKAQTQTTAWWRDRRAQNSDAAQMLNGLASDFPFPNRLPAKAVLVKLLTDPDRGALLKDEATPAVSLFLSDLRSKAREAREVKQHEKEVRAKVRAARAHERAVEAKRAADIQAQLMSEGTVPDTDPRAWRRLSEVAKLVGLSDTTIRNDIQKGHLDTAGYARGSWGNNTSLHSRAQLLAYCAQYRPHVPASLIHAPTLDEIQHRKLLIQAQIDHQQSVLEDQRWQVIEADASRAGHIWGERLPSAPGWPSKGAFYLRPQNVLRQEVGAAPHPPIWSDLEIQIKRVGQWWMQNLDARLSTCRLSAPEIKAFRKFLKHEFVPEHAYYMPWPQPLHEREVLPRLSRILDRAMNIFFKCADVVDGTGAQRVLDAPLSWFSGRHPKPRKWVLHVGPTNSGKTHQAMEAMMQARSGIYLAPLRLLALEGFDRMKERGLSCALKTGEERTEHLPVSGQVATHVSATIEAAADDDTQYDVAVIDEAQMLDDPHRGWAWAQVLAGLRAEVMHVCLAPHAKGRVAALAAQMGETVEIVEHTRLTPLSRLPQVVGLKNIQPGDAVIVFSRRQLLGYRSWLRRRGKSVAVLYGDLGPEVRRAEAERFRSGQAEFLIATDAIGMGLNLPIRRVLFAELEKFDGQERRALYQNEWEQIAGRAGRHGLYEEGFYGILGTSKTQRFELGLSAPAPIRFRPTFSVIRMLAQKLGWTHIGQLAKFWESPPRHILPSHLWAEDGWLARVASSGLELDVQYAYLGAPIQKSVIETAASWLHTHAKGGVVSLPRAEKIGPVSTRKALDELEALASRVRVYRWCALHFPATYPENPEELHAKLSGAIAASLETMALDSLCNDCGRQLPVPSHHTHCDPCFRAMRRTGYMW